MAKTEQGGYTLYSVTATTNGSGHATVYSDEPIFGEVLSISYVKTSYDNGADFTITGETSTLSLWTDTDVNASETVYPSVVRNLNTDGSALTTHSNIFLAGERVKIVVAQGGNAKTGTFRIVVKR